MRKINSINISLDDEQFKKLVNGEIVEIQHHCANAPIRIALKDIGFDRIFMHVDEAHRKFIAKAWGPKQ